MGRVGVVGAGPAGCLTARRLADAGHDVTLFEAGNRPVPTVDFASFLGRDDVRWADDDSMPPGVIRARAVGGASAINGMLLSAPDSTDLASWDAALGLDPGSARAALERVIAEVSPQIAAPGPLARTLSATALEQGEGIGGSTLDVDARGLLVTALAARSGERRDAATVYLDGAPDGLALVTDTVITSLDQPDLSAFDHLVISAGALASPPLVAAIEAGVRPTVGQQHLAVALPVPLPPALQTERDQPAVTRVLRWASGLGDGLPGASAVHSDGRGDEPVDVLERSRADLQLVVLDHMGWDAAGRGQGLVLVSLLSGSELGRATTEPDRARLRLGVRRALDLIAAAGVEAAVDLTIDADDAAIDSWVAIQPNPVHHVTSTLPLGTHVGPAGLVNGRRDRSVIDASVLPVSPRADTNMAVMVMADLLATQLITHLA